MRKIVEKYTGDRTYMFPNGEMATREVVLAHFPAALTFDHIVETDEAHEVMFACQNLSAMRGFHAIDSSLTETEAIAAIEEIINRPPEQTEDTQQRIADALQDLVVLNMPDVT